MAIEKALGHLGEIPNRDFQILATTPGNGG